MNNPFDRIKQNTMNNLSSMKNTLKPNKPITNPDPNKTVIIKPKVIPHNAEHEMGRQNLVRNVIKDNRSNKNQTGHNVNAMKRGDNPDFHN